MRQEGGGGVVERNGGAREMIMPICGGCQVCTATIFPLCASLQNVHVHTHTFVSTRTRSRSSGSLQLAGEATVTVTLSGITGQQSVHMCTYRLNVNVGADVWCMPSHVSVCQRACGPLVVKNSSGV